MILRNKYTEKELAIIALFHLKSKVSIPEMIEAIERSTGEKVTRQAVAARIRTMAGKLALDGHVLKRTSRLGRGAYGTYVMTKVGS